jgi:hypothetical protein
VCVCVCVFVCVCVCVRACVRKVFFFVSARTNKRHYTEGIVYLREA